MRDEDDKPKRPSAHDVGMPLEAMSVGELAERVELLEGEIERLRAAIEAKTQSKSAADAVFKL